VVSGTFSFGHATVQFLAGAAGGIAIGLVVGWLIAEVRKRTVDPQISITISLLTGYAAFVPASAVGASGVLAVVTAGIYMGLQAPRILTPRTRLQSGQLWELLGFLVNAALFVLVGLQLRIVVEGLDQSAWTLAGYALAVSAVVIASRFVWINLMTVVLRTLDRREVQRARRASWRLRFIAAWSGMRGAVSLAAALALPFATDADVPFPARDLIIFLTFAVIFVTLVLQGLTLPMLIRRLGVVADDSEHNEELRARLTAAKAAIDQIDALRDEEWTRDETLERMRALYDYRKRRFAAQAGKIEDDGYEDRSLTYQQTVQVVLAAQRDALVRLRDEGTISNDVMNRVIRELDLEESRLEI
jgi:Na+/H+ antiporter